MTASTVNTDVLPSVGDNISGKERIRLNSVIGDGGYGIVFNALYGNRQVAFKAEKYTQSMLNIEVAVMQSAEAHNCRHIMRLIEHGTVERKYAWIIIPLLGPDLHRLRSEQAARRFSLNTSLRITILALQGIQELHDKCGYISRDIKPGNFAIGLQASRRELFLFDFGLARRYLDRNNNIIPSRGQMGWRGTTRYGSLQAHLRQDLSRKDDVESWFYMLCEFVTGALPWRNITDRGQVHAAKLAARTAGRSVFLRDCPSQLSQILDYIDHLEFSSQPNYGRIIHLLQSIMTENNFRWEDSYDWDESGGVSAQRSVSENERAQVERPSQQQRPH